MFKKKSHNPLLDPNHTLVESHDILGGYLVDYPNNVPIMENFDDLTFDVMCEKDREEFNKLMVLLFNQKESNRLQKVGKYVRLINRKNECHVTPLMMAARMARGMESLKILEFILTNINVNEIDAQDSSGKSALLYACSNIDESSSIEACRILLRYGASPNLLDDKGCNALMVYALNNKSGDSIGLARLLIDHNVNIHESSTNNKLTALMIACLRFDYTKDESLISILIRSGADINKQNQQGDSILMQLCKKKLEKSIDVIKLLIKYNASVEIVNQQGHTVIDILFEQKGNKKNEIINLLVK